MIVKKEIFLVHTKEEVEIYMVKNMVIMKINYFNVIDSDNVLKEKESEIVQVQNID